MRTILTSSTLVACAAAAVLAAIASGCGASKPPPTFDPAPIDAGDAGGDDLIGTDGDASLPLFPSGSGDAGHACPPGLSCDVPCPSGAMTTVTGKVYDPAGRNPLYNVAVYVPAMPLTPLPRGVPTGADACSCGALFPSGALTNTTTAVDGTFTLTNVPVSSKVPLVIQIGKWRRQITVPVTACVNNPQPDKSLAFLGAIPPGDVLDSMPDIAVSTGGCDTLECLMFRAGISSSEYVPGASASGHVHVFSGGRAGTGTQPESPPMANAPNSSSSLWDSQADLMPYDIVLLSCECGETYKPNPPALEQYLNAGGRVFGSHFHYVWFGGTANGSGNGQPSPPGDWGSNLADWFPLQTIVGGIATPVETLTGTTAPFPKGVAFHDWLGVVGALGIEGAPAGRMPIFDEKADVGAANKAQAWLTDNGYTDYLSFDTPVTAATPSDGGLPHYCGRAVFSDLHLNSDPYSPGAGDVNPPPTGCASGALSPQEKALEFMLFDLSSCVLPDNVAPPIDAGLPQPPR